MKSSLISLCKNISILFSSQKISALPQERNESCSCFYSGCFWFPQLQSKVQLCHCIFSVTRHSEVRKWEKRSVSLKLQWALRGEQLCWPLFRWGTHPLQLHGLGLGNQLVIYKTSLMNHRGAAWPTTLTWDKFPSLYCHLLTERPWQATSFPFPCAPQL